MEIKRPKANSGASTFKNKITNAQYAIVTNIPAPNINITKLILLVPDVFSIINKNNKFVGIKNPNNPNPNKKLII